MRWDTSSETEFSQNAGTILESGQDVVGGQGEHLSIEELSVLKNLGDVHLVREWIDLKLIEKKSLSSINLVSLSDDLLWSNNLNLGLDNLGLDLKVLEERSLLWIKTSWTGWDCDAVWGNHTSLGWGWSHLRVENILDLTEVSVGEDDVDVSLELSEDLIDSVPDSSIFVIFPELVEASLHESLQTLECLKSTL